LHRLAEAHGDSGGGGGSGGRVAFGGLHILIITFR
jgi:hypothetical protein